MQATSRSEWANQINCTSRNRITTSFACGESELSLIRRDDGLRIEGWGLVGTRLPAEVYIHEFLFAEM